ncbi:MAG TPA: hypothetical protein VE078_19555, partial [Thermoanaerobaculia bacterium]|nr:hypothetical protein [Thermoanaerobaculia bacterium]
VVRLEEEKFRDLRPHEIGDPLAAPRLLFHRDVSDMNELVVVIEDVSVQIPFDEAQDPLQERV